MTPPRTYDGNQPDGSDYHRKELAIAGDPTAPGHCLPPVSPTYRRVLDVGCGAGQTLLALNLPPTVEAWGVDIDSSAIALGQRLAPQLRLLCAAGEQLPLEIYDVDFVYSRVALPYMDIEMALSEMARVLRPGGTLWLVLHPARMTLKELTRAMRQRKLVDIMGRCYVLACGGWFWLTGRTFRAPWGAHRTESWQSVRGMQRALARAGFGAIAVGRSSHFIVTARLDR